MSSVTYPHEHWMRDLPPEVRSGPFRCLKIPGTHDSGACQVDFKKTAAESRWTRIGALAARTIPWVSRVITDWTRTQQDAIYEQLRQGIRVFDFRVSYRDQDGEFYITHTFTCQRLSEL